MRLSSLAIALGAALTSSSALAENWVTVFEDDGFELSVDKDSIRLGSDNLVYYQSMAFDLADSAADCQNKKLYTVKIHAHGGLVDPNWRQQGQEVSAGSAGDAELRFVCTNS